MAFERLLELVEKRGGAGCVVRVSRFEKGRDEWNRGGKEADFSAALLTTRL
jgi:hypothetical protein